MVCDIMRINSIYYMKVIIINSILWLCFVIIAVHWHNQRSNRVYTYRIHIIFRHWPSLSAGLFIYTCILFSRLLSSNLSNCRYFFIFIFFGWCRKSSSFFPMPLGLSLSNRHIDSFPMFDQRAHITRNPSVNTNTLCNHACMCFGRKETQTLHKHNLCHRRD